MTVLEKDQARFDQASALLAAGRLDEAEALLQHLVDTDHPQESVLNHLGVIAFRRGRYADAAMHFGREAALRPDSANALSNLAACALNLDQPEQALVYADQALQLDPEELNAHNHRGVALTDMLQHDAAIPSLLKGVARIPDDLAALVNLARTYREANRQAEAMIWYDRALALEPGNIEANFSRALALLQLGDFERGLAGYEWRWQKDVLRGHLHKHDKPRWVGQLDLAGGSILLQEEQGLGDTLQFSRYALLLAKQGAHVILQVRPALRALFACFENTITVIGVDDPLPAFHCHSPLMSLPLACGTRLDTIPAPARYLGAPADRLAVWRDRLGQRRRPRIGIAWSGRPEHSNDRARSMSLADFPIPNPELFDVCSLQHVVRPADQPMLDGLAIRQLGPQFADMADTAAVAELMDLVITVDTSVAHVAAALGRPVWLLLPFNADWRWLVGRDDSPWYPTVRIFRQARFGDWKGVFDRVTVALAEAAGIAHAA